jgi:NAD(P)-dependent dehydrogenase (short-subunit alcohol dehydrogenase family)
MSDQRKLHGRTAIVTGAAVRLGRAIALALAEDGCDVLLHYGSSANEAAAAAQQITRLGRKAMTVSADLTRPVEAAQRIFDAAELLGGADILVNSAAIFEDAPLREMSEANYNRHLTINLKAPTFLCREFARRLRSGRRGHILNLADWRAETPPADLVAYSLSKAGLVALTKSLALSLAPAIQINAIAPGAILPPPDSDDPGQWEAWKRPAIPLQRVGSIKDIVEAALYLVRSEFVTGEVLHVTGGEHL